MYDSCFEHQKDGRKTNWQGLALDSILEGFGINI